jgi:hypothetical protein
MTSPDSHGYHGAADEHNETVDHEHSDVNIRAILSFGAGLVAIVAVSAVIIRILFGVLERQAEAQDPAMSPVAMPAGRQPPDPALVTNEPGDLARFRVQQTKTLESYGWVDQQGGVAHVPIEDAKKLLLQGGLPARSGAVDALEGTHAFATGESSGGRTITRKPAAGAQPPAAGAAAGETPIKK